MHLENIDSFKKKKKLRLLKVTLILLNILTIEKLIALALNRIPLSTTHNCSQLL